MTKQLAAARPQGRRKQAGGIASSAAVLPGTATTAVKRAAQTNRNDKAGAAGTKAATTRKGKAADPVPALPAPAPAAATPKRGVTAVDQRIYRAVVTAVMSHRLPPGTRLGEADFCELYGVSRTTVRKALQRLAHDHIIELRPNRGAVIASPTPREAGDIFAARRALEREIVPLVARNATPASLAALRAALAAEEGARRDGDRAGWIRLGGEFHLLLADLAGNTVLQRFLNELVSRCSLIIALYEAPGAPMCGNGEHGDLVALIEAGDVDGAVALIDHHLLAVEGRLHLGEPERKVNLAEALAGC